ncbi:hypothetical protein PTKIN_Ptkin02bG0066900 [Pterospermum kingtungense]
MRTEMTPIASQEPSRTTTPIRATTSAARSYISSGSSTPVRCQNEVLCAGPTSTEGRGETNVGARGNGTNGPYGQESRIHKNNNSDQDRK